MDDDKTPNEAQGEDKITYVLESEETQKEAEPKEEPRETQEEQQVDTAPKKNRAQDRINELIYQRHQANRRVREAEELNSQMRQELQAVNDRLEQMQEVQNRTIEGQINQRRQALIQRKNEAIAEGDTATASTMEGHIEDLRTQEARWRAQQPRPKQKSQPETQQQQSDEPVNPNLLSWYQKNQTWWNDTSSKNRRKRSWAEVIDRELSTEGWDANTPDYFEELDRRLSEVVPAEPNSDATVKANTSPVAPTPKSSRPRPKSDVVITKQDQRYMEDLGLDPANEVHLKRYAAEKRALEQRQ